MFAPVAVTTHLPKNTKFAFSDFSVSYTDKDGVKRANCCVRAKVGSSEYDTTRVLQVREVVTESSAVAADFHFLLPVGLKEATLLFKNNPAGSVLAIGN